MGGNGLINSLACSKYNLNSKQPLFIVNTSSLLSHIRYFFHFCKQSNSKDSVAAPLVCEVTCQNFYFLLNKKKKKYINN